MAAKDISLVGATFYSVPQVDLPISGGGTASFVEISDTTATAADVASGKYFYTAAGVKTEGTASGGSANIEELNVTQNGTYTASGGVDGYSPVIVNVSGGGGGIGTLLATYSLGSFSTTSTTATDTGKRVPVSGIDAYDLLIVETSVDTEVNDRHLATVRPIFLSNATNISTKNTATLGGNCWNAKKSSTGIVSTRVGNNSNNGIYPNSATISNGDASIVMYIRYNSTATGTINNSYTTRVYGVNLCDLIGG